MATAAQTPRMVTINITGSNDAPVTTPVDVAGTITEGGTLLRT